jgi:hypothetical protein
MDDEQVDVRFGASAVLLASARSADYVKGLKRWKRYAKRASRSTIVAATEYLHQRPLRSPVLEAAYPLLVEREGGARALAYALCMRFVSSPLEPSLVELLTRVAVNGDSRALRLAVKGLSLMGPRARPALPVLKRLRASSRSGRLAEKLGAAIKLIEGRD